MRHSTLDHGYYSAAELLVVCAQNLKRVQLDCLVSITNTLRGIACWVVGLLLLHSLSVHFVLNPEVQPLHVTELSVNTTQAR